MKEITIYTDGACSGNPGPGGWGAVLIFNGHRKDLSGGEKMTTNNRMEIQAVISALSQLEGAVPGQSLQRFRLCGELFSTGLDSRLA